MNLTLRTKNYTDYVVVSPYAPLRFHPRETAPQVDRLILGDTIRITQTANGWGRTLWGTWVEMANLRIK